MDRPGNPQYLQYLHDRALAVKHIQRIVEKLTSFAGQLDNTGVDDLPADIYHAAWNIINAFSQHSRARLFYSVDIDDPGDSDRQ